MYEKYIRDFDYFLLLDVIRRNFLKVELIFHKKSNESEVIQT